MAEEAPLPYQRVDHAQLKAEGTAGPVPDGGTAPAAARHRVRWIVLPLSLLLCVLQAVVTVYAENASMVILTATLISVMAFGFLFLLVLAVNPLLRLICLAPSPLWRVCMAIPMPRAIGKALSVLRRVCMAIPLPREIGRVLSPLWRVCIAAPLRWVIGMVLSLLRTISRPFNRTEVMCLFAAVLVTSGFSTFGLSSQIIPIMAAPWNPEWNTPQRGWSTDVLPNLNPKLYLSVPADGTEEQKQAALANIHQFRQGLQPSVPMRDEDGRLVRDEHGDIVMQKVLAPPESAPLMEKARYWALVGVQIPWGTWLRPLGYWMMFIVAAYGLFYSLTYVVMGYWDKREKLIFPLAKLPEALLPDADSKRWLPAMLSTPGFWAAFALTFLFLSWNGAASAQWILGLEHIPLGLASLDDVVKGTTLEGVSGAHGLQFLIIFTAIGIAFLLPVEISFSIWFYHLLGQLMLLVAVWMGYGQTTSDFPTDWLWYNNPVTAQGAGAILVFSLVSLSRAVAESWRQGRGMPWSERLPLLLPVIGMVLCATVLIVWFHWNRLPLAWALALTVALIIISLGLMRIVAEGGIYWFQTHAGVFNIYKAFAIGKVLPGALVAPLVPIYWILFLDIKTFLAPNLHNAAKMNQDAGRNRFLFHANLVITITVSVVVALGFTILMAHVVGAQQMHSWFHSSGPQLVIDTAQRAASEEPEFQATTAAFYGIGGAWVILSMFLRRTLFWFPHPIGYMMMVNPLTRSIWFSFFIGWVCKKFVVKYGGKATFDKAKVIFIGMIMGELMAILVWSILGMIFQFGSTLTLNRYAA